MIDLRGRTALVTGSTQGVGRAIVTALARAGADVVVHGHVDVDATANEAEAVLAECRACGVRAEAIGGDLAGPTEACVAAVHRAATEAMPEIDILVNNAGGLFDVPFVDMDLARWERTFRLNVTAPYFLTLAFARDWIARGVAGRVLFTGSINGRLAEQVHTAYDTSKGAVDALVRTLCVSLAPHGIRVNGMAPGLVRTPLTRPAVESERFQRWMELHTPNQCVPEADVCGGAAAFLVSDLAEHVQGQMLLVDGGMSAWQQPDPPANWA